ncbi:MAG: type III secretion system cytoplasmic ring protein SctQ [Myxococcaceae bacterium]|nr:type III secretion system cytoplasmic ring protein SctQ [Myxococcaceae bacterium]
MMIDVSKIRQKPPASGTQTKRPAAPPPPPPPARAPARDWQPFSFANLEKLTKTHGRLARNLEWMLPNVRSTGEVSESVKKRLSEMLDEKISLQAEYLHFIHPSKLRRYVGDPTFLGVLAPIPNKARGLLEVDIGLAHWAIDTLLGGTGEAVGLRPLTDIEEGVMTFVVLETLKALAPSLDSALPKLRLETIAPSLDAALGVLQEEETLAVVQLKAIFGGHTGYVRLFIPESVLAVAEPAPDAPVRRQRRAADAVAHATRLSNVKVWLRAEIGQVEISAGDLAQLRERDVVLVDGLSARPDKHEGGTARLKLGLGRTGFVAADIAIDSDRYVATVTGIHVGEPPPPGQPIEGGEEQPAAEAAEGEPQEPPALGEGPDESTNPGAERANMEEGQAEGADLLNDVPLQIAVEVGRLPISAEDVVGLKVGHVFDLNRQVGEPLDLSVNGKVVARGELVEIEGNLGIRIVSLAG